jgi:hypothetical protein
MNSTNFISQIIWPETLKQLDKHCFLIGWNLDSFECSVSKTLCHLPSSKYETVNSCLALNNLGPALVTDVPRP